MGIDRMAARFLLATPQAGVRFDRTLTIGRQELYAGEAGLSAELKRAGYSRPRVRAREMLAAGGYAEPLFKLLGGINVESVDASSYERATLIHDLNKPVPSDWRSSYSAVIDSGSLEHIFDVATALHNYMELVAPGGHLIGAYPGNDQIGHGFYQFSPELFFGLLSEDRGFRVLGVYLLERGPRERWFRAPNPAELRGRIVLRSRWPTDLFVLAHRLRVPPGVGRANAPQQHFYRSMWTDCPSGETEANESRMVAALRRRVPLPLRRVRRLMIEYRRAPHLARRLPAVDITRDLGL